MSLVVVVPAVSGPYDLGNVAVRAAVSVNPVTAQVTTTSDPLPQILEGVPLRGRSIRLNLDRPGFALNPTNCDPFAVECLDLRRRRSERNRDEPLPGGELRRPGVRPEAEHQAQGLDETSRPSGSARCRQNRPG